MMVCICGLRQLKKQAFEVPAVKEAFDGITFNCPSGYEISLGSENNYVARGVFMDSVNENQAFDILWQSDDTQNQYHLVPTLEIP